MDNIHDNWDEVESVAMALELSDPGQPYSCATWENQFNNSEPKILHGGSPYYHWWGMFETTYVPAHAFIDHNMTVHYKTNTLGSYVANLRIEEMLEDCGECYVDGIYQDFGQEDCCEIFGGTYYGYDEGAEYDELSCTGSDAVWSSLCLCSGTVDSDGDGIADNCDDCYNLSGDTNEDAVIDILDIVGVVNIILNGGINASGYTACELDNANINSDSTINVLDIIQIINAILGQGRIYSDLDATADLNSSINGNNLVVSINSEVPLSGVQLSFYTDEKLNVRVNDSSSDIYASTKLLDGIQRYVGFSMENMPFEDNLEIIIENGSDLSKNDIDIVLASTEGNDVSEIWTESSVVNAFAVSKMFPNPFNPSTEINYTVNQNGSMRIAVYNILGQQVAELYNGYRDAGTYNLQWNAENMASGVYYVNIAHSNGQTENMKAVLLK